MVGPWLSVSAAFALGVALAGALRPHPVVALVGLLCAVVVVLAARRTRAHGMLLLLAVMLAGAARLSFAATLARGTIWAWQGRTATVTGTLLETPRPQGTRWVALLAAEAVESEGQAGLARGRVWVQWREKPGPRQAGQRVSVPGRLDVPPVAVHPGDFDMGAYLRVQGAFVSLRAQGGGQMLGDGAAAPGASWLEARQRSLLDRMERFWPGEPGALLRAVVFGQRVDLGRETVDDFHISGAYALLAVSGLNVAAVAGLVMGLLLLCRARRTHAAWLAALAVLAYALLTTGGASVWRAALMGVVGLLTLAFGVRRNPWGALGLAVLLILLVQPFALFTPALQLSCGGVVGIFLWQKRLHTFLAPKGRRAERWQQRLWWQVAGGLAVGVSAQAALTPLLLYWFGEFAPLGLPVGLVGDLWLVACLATAGVGLVLGGLPMVGVLLRWPAGALAAGALSFTHAAAQVPGGFWRPGLLGLGWTLATYAGMVAVDLWLRRREMWALELRQRWWAKLTPWGSRGPRRAGLAVLAAIGVVAGVAGCAVGLHSSSHGELRLYVLNVGQGDALLLRAPGSQPHWWLIDGGPAPAVGTEGHDDTAHGALQDEGEEVVVPALRRLGVTRLDVVVLTHAHQDHAGGLTAVLQAVEVGEVWDTGFDLDSSGYHRFLAEVAQRQIPVHQPVQGAVQGLGEADLRVLWPAPGFKSDDPNENSIVLQVTYGQSSWLLMGDAGTVVEEQLLQTYGEALQADFLKVGHHGSQTSTGAAWLHTTKPALAVISAGAGNKFGHPDVRLLGRLRVADVLTTRTDADGTLVVSSDGRKTRLLQGRPGLPITLAALPGERWPPAFGAW